MHAELANQLLHVKYLTLGPFLPHRSPSVNIAVKGVDRYSQHTTCQLRSNMLSNLPLINSYLGIIVL